MTIEEAQKILNELDNVRPELLNDEAKRLFEAIMKIADERDSYKSMLEEKDKVIDLMAETIMEALCEFEFEEFESKQEVKQYFENKAKEDKE